MMQVAIEQIIQRPNGLYLRARRKDEDGVEEVRWVGPFESADAIAAWLILLEVEASGGTATALETLGLPVQLAQLNDVSAHARAAALGKPKLAMFRLDQLAALTKAQKN